MTSALVLGAGEGRRFGRRKQFSTVAGVPLLALSAARLAAHSEVDELVVAAPGDGVDETASLLAERGLDARVVPGGGTRTESVHRGLGAVTGEYVLVHDGARPVLSLSLVDRVIEAMKECGAAAPGLPVRDTLKRLNGGVMSGRVEREGLVRLQTPQGFRTELLRDALTRAKGRDFTDDTTLVEETTGVAATFVRGEEENIKVTLPEDLALVERLSASSVRVGHGRDAHPFAPGRKYVLGGVELPGEGLLGHSDGDALCHAVTDALLGAVALGDIGLLFGDDDPKWKDADSLELLSEAAGLLRSNGHIPTGIDATVVAVRPRVSDHREGMTANLGRAAGLPPEAVSVKGKSGNGLGFAGRGEGVLVYAVATVLAGR